MEFNEEYQNLILEQVSLLCPNKRTSKYSNEYYLEKIIHVLRDVVSWNSLQKVFKFKQKTHYKTIQDIHFKWATAEVFKKAHTKLIETKKLSKINSSTTLNLFIDSTAIFNKTGQELVNYGEYKKKKTTKISVICNENKDILDVTFYKGSEHDTKTIEPSLQNIINTTSFRKINLTGDLGYLSNLKKRTELKDKKIILITPTRKNMRRRTTKIEKNHLHKRYLVENSIQTLKRFNRISVRKDKLIKTYSSFVYLALILIFKE